MAGKTRSHDYAEAAERILAPIAEANGVRIYDVEYVKEGSEYFLRAYIDRDGGVTIGDCENVSRALSDALDGADPIPDAYTLEVSSPGLGRSLTKDRHFSQSIGAEVELKLYKPRDDTKQKEFRGILKAFDSDTVTVTVDTAAKRHKKGQTPSKHAAENAAPEDLVFTRKEIAVIRLALDF
jgi:ribosome maturation factor RimP